MKSAAMIIVCAALLATVGSCSEDAASDTDTTPADTIPVIDYDAVVSYDTATPPADTKPSTTPPGDTATDGDTSADPCLKHPRPFFCPCDNNTQCDSGYCIPVDELDVSFRCSRTCDATCPNGWDCRGVAGEVDPIFICQPPIDTLCDPCTTDAQCGISGDRCVTFDDGDFCGQDCQGAEDSCPERFECGEIKDDLGQITSYQCVPVSGSCNCPPGTDYTSDPDNCKTCNHKCTYPGGIGGCADSTCYLADCDGAHVDLNDFDPDGCEYECTKAGDDDWPEAACDGSDCDQDCDGIDGSHTRGIFVAKNGSHTGAGTADDPVSTIAKGIELAQGSASKDHVYIAAGTYNEAVNVKDGVSLFGGYSNDGSWTRDLSRYTTIIRSTTGTTSIRTLVAQNVGATRTVIGGLRVESGDNSTLGGSSYAVWIKDCTNKLELTRLEVVGGSGGAGANGTGYTSADRAASGVIGQPGATTTDTDWRCDDFDDYGGDGGAYGTNQCSSGANARGGKGGNSGCGEDGNDPDAQPGETSPGGAAGGPAPNASQVGNPGTHGGSGAAGGHGTGGLAGGTVSASGFWRGNDGNDGTDGGNGVGGGGGSGGGGDNNCGACFASWGGGGGGGGSGGCGGQNGRGGRAGGGSFGVFVHDANPRITDSALGHNSGGHGGNGGLGQLGGYGRGGGASGDGHKDAERGGNGGSGGGGGSGGNGGGGAGGVAFSLYLAGSSAPICAGLSFDPPGGGGTPGTGGVGGNSAGNRGADGTHGDRNKSVGTCQ